MHLVEAKVEGINNITIMKDPSLSNKNRGFAFVEFTTHQLAAKAHGRILPLSLFSFFLFLCRLEVLRILNSTEGMTRPDFRLGGLAIKCDWAEPLNEPPEEVMKTVTNIIVPLTPYHHTHIYSIIQVKSIYVCNLPSNVDEEMMKSVFAEFGEIERIVLSRNLTSAVRILL